LEASVLAIRDRSRRLAVRTGPIGTDALLDSSNGSDPRWAIGQGLQHLRLLRFREVIDLAEPAVKVLVVHGA
jgi:hypothetical protein